MTATGTLFIVSAPSGAGKTSLVTALLKRRPELGISVSHTTRACRPGEVDGKNYHFIDANSFQEMVQAGAFLEHAEVFGNHYGTSRFWVESELNAGRDVILEIDWQGALQVHQKMPEAVAIFILPPSFETLSNRLSGRGTDKPEVVAKRLAGAGEEIRHYQAFDYLVINGVFEEALEQLVCITRAENLRTRRQAARQADLIEHLLNSRPNR